MLCANSQKDTNLGSIIQKITNKSLRLNYKKSYYLYNIHT